MKKIVLKEGVETVEDGAFNEFVKVNKIVFPIKLKKIGVSAFGDTGIRQLILPDSVTEIGWIAFVKNTIYGGIEKIRLPKKLCRIDSGAFSGHNFTSITIPKNVTFIGSRVFEECSELKTIIIKSKKIKKIGSNAFSYIAREAVIYVPGGKIKKYRKLMPEIDAYGHKWDIRPIKRD